MKAVERANMIASAIKKGLAQYEIASTVIVRKTGKTALIGVSMTQPVTQEIEKYINDYFCDITKVYEGAYGFYCTITE